MASKVYRLKIKKVPLQEEIPYKKPNFPPFKDLHLDLLENKLKLRKNPPKPIFVRTEPYREDRKSGGRHHDDDSSDTGVEDFTLDELEKAYTNNNASDDEDEVFSDSEDLDLEPETKRSGSKDTKDTDDRNKERKDDRDDRTNRDYDARQFEQEEEQEVDKEAKERQEVEDLLFKFMVLRRQYPNIEIPEFTDHSDVVTMRRFYDKTIRRVSLDSSVESYKQYIVGGFMVLEWVSTNWLGIDLSGFTQQQSKMMNRYERLLIELGEKNYSTLGSRFPVEVRLMFFVFFNAGLFYVNKMIFSGGEGGAAVLNVLFGGGQQQQAPPAGVQRAAPQQRRRGAGMRGPTITPHEVEELTRNEQMDSDHEKDD